MKKFLLYIIFITLPISIWADDDVYEKSVYKADSIMNKVFKSTAFYSKHIMSFEGQAYLKGVTKVEKSNFMLKYFPSVFPFERNTDGTIFETIKIGRAHV